MQLPQHNQKIEPKAKVQSNLNWYFEKNEGERGRSLVW